MPSILSEQRHAKTRLNIFVVVIPKGLAGSSSAEPSFGIDTIYGWKVNAILYGRHHTKRRLGKADPS